MQKITWKQKWKRFASILTAAALVVSMLSLPTVGLKAQAASLALNGSGTSASPYEITSQDDLVGLATALNNGDSQYTGKSFILTKDIALTDKFSMINTFSGTLNGAGHVISGLIINDPSAKSAAFIGTNSGTVEDLFLDNVSVTGSAGGGNCAAGLISNNTGTVIQCSVTGTISAPTWEQASGLVGKTGATAKITDCYFKGSATSYFMPAGIVSYGKGSIANCYAYADLTALSTTNTSGRTTQQGNDAGLICSYPGSASPMLSVSSCVAGGGSITMNYPNAAVNGFVGRIVGYTGYKPTMSNNIAYSAIKINNAAVTSNNMSNQQGADKSDAELQSQDTYTALGWDFSNVWQMNADTGRPELRKGQPISTMTLSGSGTASSPYLLNNEDELVFWATQLNNGNTVYTGKKYYNLMSDISLTKAFPMVNNFVGTLDGMGHTVNGFSVTGDVSANASYKAAFIKNNAGTLQNLTLKDVSVSVTGTAGAGPMAAGLVAENAAGGVIQRCTVTGTIDGQGLEKAAGIAASNKGGTVQDCYVDGNITAKFMAGGIVGSNSANGSVSRCFANVQLTATANESNPAFSANPQQGNDAAAICAYPDTGTIQDNVMYGSSITYAYNQSGAATDGYYGRIIGYTANSKSISNNLANAAATINGKTVSGSADDANGKDTSLSDLQSQATYESLNWDFGGVWKMDDSLKHPVLNYVDSASRPDRIVVTVNGDPQTRRGFSWYTTADVAKPVVKISKTKDFSNAAEISADKEGLTNGIHYTAIAQSLLPATTYYYRLGDDTTNVFSAVGSFTTAAGSGAFSFINLTDTQATDDAEAQISATTIAKACDTLPNAAFMLHGGDFVETGSDESTWKSMLGFSQASLLKTTLVPAAGNHEAAANQYISHFNVEKNGDTTKGSYYSYDYNNAHFTVLNTNEDSTQCLSATQLQWLTDDVTAARNKGAQWVILSLHKGPYTTGTHSGDTDIKALRKVLVPLIDQLKIDLVFEGHDHILSRTKVLKYDASGTECATPVETTQYSEIIGSKRIDYSVSPNGTIYYLSDTAGAKHYAQNDNPNGIDADAYLNLFDRSQQGVGNNTSEQTAQYFTGVTIDGGRLTAQIYQIRDNAAPFVWEGFGIDKEITPVIDAINALPGADKLTLSDKAAVTSAKAAFDKLDSTQKAQVTNVDKLNDLSEKIVTLLAQSGKSLPWFDDTAAARQSISIHNSTASAFTDSPVLLKIKDIPANTTENTLKFYTTAGIAVPYEVENWNPQGTTTVWVKVPELPANSTASIWAYYGGTTAVNDSTNVWNDTYELVEHFDKSTVAGSSLTDSTGKQTGTVSGNGLTATAQNDGTLGEQFNNTKIAYGDLGGGLDQVSVSAVYQATADDLSKITDSQAQIFSKCLSGSGANDTLSFGISKDGSQLLSRYLGVWYESGPNNPNKTEAASALPQDGKPHLVTLTYDGMTVAVYVDGQRVYQNFAEYRTTIAGKDTPTTIGAFSDIGAIKSPFSGTLDELQMSNYRVTPEWEAFRYSNYFGNAVSCGTLQLKADAGIELDISSPADGSAAETGMIQVTGIVSKACSFTAEVASKSYACGTSEAGKFSVLVPVNKTGTQTIKLTAANKDDPKDTAAGSVSLQLSDTTPPKQPTLSDSSKNGVMSSGSATLTAKTADDCKEVSASFYSNTSISLTSANTVVRTGTATASLPDGVAPTDGTAASSLFSTTTGTGANPFQIYEVSLTDGQANASQFHLVWNGTAEREVTAYVYNTAGKKWVKVGSAYNPNAASISINMNIANKDVLTDNKLTLLIWRGMTDSIEGRSSYAPEAGQFDFSMAFIPDEQLYTQAYAGYMKDQYNWIVQNAQQMKTKMVLQIGDFVNRPYVNQEFQWKNADAGVKLLEAAHIPYAIAWGNHDYDSSSNDNIMFNKYYPASRMQSEIAAANQPDVTWGGAFSKYKGTSSDDTYYLMQENGAKIMLLTIGYWQSTDDINWAADVISQHPDYSVILATHNYMYSGSFDISNADLYNKIVKPYKNVKLVLCGHNGDAGYRYDNFGDHETYGILCDYQGLPFGGLGFLRNIKFDVENNLVYFNTYSSMSDDTLSPYGSGTYANPNGGNLYQHNCDDFAIKLDLGGGSARTLTTNSLTLAGGDPIQVGQAQTVTGTDTVSVKMTGLTRNTPYEWYAVLTDESGNQTTSDVKYFATADQLLPTVTSVDVTPSTPTLQTGSTQDFKATVNGENNPSQDVVWKVSGNNSKDTAISDKGQLTVASDETSESLIVTATSATDDTISGTATVNVDTEADITGISMQSLPAKTEYVQGQSLNTTGASIKVTYQGGSTKTVSVTSDMVSGYDSGKTGAQDLTVTYQNKTASFKVNVMPSVIYDKSNKISADISNVTLPENVTSVRLTYSIEATSSDDTAAVKALLEQSGSSAANSSLVLYNIELVDQNNNKIDFTGSVVVRIPVPDGMTSPHVFWFDGKSLHDMNAVVQDGFLVFTTTHFSTYAIASVNAPSANTDSGNTNSGTGTNGSTSTNTNSNTSSVTSKVSNPSTGSGTVPSVLIALSVGMVLLAVCGTVYLIWRKRKMSYHQR